jgi:hypothetical protein
MPCSGNDVSCKSMPISFHCPSTVVHAFELAHVPVDVLVPAVDRGIVRPGCLAYVSSASQISCQGMSGRSRLPASTRSEVRSRRSRYWINSLALSLFP